MNSWRRIALSLWCAAIGILQVPVRAAPAAVGAQIAGSFADASGHSAQSHLVFAANSGVWWLFTLTSAADSAGGSNHLVKAYRSSGPDLATAVWTPAVDSPGATTASSTNCVSCIMAGGRALGVAYVNAGGIDVVHAEVAMAADGQNGLTAHIRATLTATTIAWQTWDYHDEAAATWTVPRSVTLGVSSGSFIHSAGPTLQQEVDANARVSISPDTSAGWSSGFYSVAVIDNSMIHENNAFAFAPLDNNVMLAVYDNGAGPEPSLTNLRYRRSNADGSWSGVVVGSQGGGDGNVFAGDATIDQNDWALIPITAAQVYAFRKNAAATGVDAAVYGPSTNTWSAFAAPPLFGAGQGFLIGGGLFGATDGSRLWLFVVSSDAARTILYTRHDASGWSAWAAVPGTDTGGHARGFISGYPRVSANQIGLIWTEGSGPYDVAVAPLIVADTAAPQVSLTAPADGSSVFGAVTVAATASDNVAVSGVTLQIDGVTQGPVQSIEPYRWTWDSLPVANGNHTITALAADAAGNSATASVSVLVSNAPDTTPPAISGVTVFSITATSALIGWTTDERATSALDYGTTSAYGASALNASLTTAHTVPIGALTPATTYHYRVSSTDAADNVALWTDAIFTTAALDTSPPTVSVTGPVSGATISGTSTVSATAADDTGVAGVQFLLDGANLGAEVTTVPYAVSWTTTTAANGAHTLSARARDGAGNQTTSLAVPVTVANVAPPLVDVIVSGDRASARTVQTPAFSTVAGGELLLALVSASDNAAANSVSAVTGAGLSWTLVRRSNTQRGTAEIWRAFAASALRSVLVQAQFAQMSPAASITVVSLSRVDPAGTNGSAAIGATASAAGVGVATAAVVTTRNNSLVFGVGDDGTAAVSRTVGSGQMLLHQFLAGGKTVWAQRAADVVAAAGTSVVISDTAPNGDRYNLAVCEVLGKP